jgi:hypothetical protein
MKIILDIIKAAGKNATDPDLYIKITNDPWMSLTIEGIGPGPSGQPAISVCHYGEQSGDLMRDPEMCFELTKGAEGTPILYPYYWRNDYAGIEQESRFVRDGREMIRLGWLREHKSFAQTWNNNIREQGFLQAVKGGKATVH